MCPILELFLHFILMDVELFFTFLSFSFLFFSFLFFFTVVGINFWLLNGIRFKLELRGTRRLVGPHPRSQPLCCHLFFIDRKSLWPLIALTRSFQFPTLATDSQPIRFSLSLSFSLFWYFPSLSFIFKKIIPSCPVSTFPYWLYIFLLSASKEYFPCVILELNACLDVSW